MEIKVICPHCGGEVFVEEGYVNIFCSSCGQKIEIMRTDEVHVVVPWVRKLEEADLCMKIKEYEKAEKIIAQLIEEDPGNFWLYRPYVEAITKDYGMLHKENMGRILPLIDKTIALAPEEYREEALLWKDRVIESHRMQEKQHAYYRWEEKEKKAREYIWVYSAFFIVSVILFLVARFLYNDPAVVEITVPMFGGAMVLCAFLLVVNAVKYKRALRRCKKLSAEINAWIEMVHSR